MPENTKNIAISSQNSQKGPRTPEETSQLALRQAAEYFWRLKKSMHDAKSFEIGKIWSDYADEDSFGPTAVNPMLVNAIEAFLELAE